jgi:hypothetical protein
MMATRFALLRTTLLCLILAVAFLMPAFAQQAASKTTNKKTNQTAPTASQTPAPTTSKTKAGETTCDGALEIIPRKQVTFIRKRRPTGAPPTPTTPADAKPEKKSSGEINKDSRNH